jgi:hypothetical protein
MGWEGGKDHEHIQNFGGEKSTWKMEEMGG